MLLPKTFSDIIQFAKSGGHILFSILAKDWDENGYKDEADRLEEEGLWKFKIKDSLQFEPDGINTCYYTLAYMKI